MSFGKLEQQDYQQDTKESTQQDLSMEQILAQTSQELKDLQNKIIESTLFDNQEKEALSTWVNSEILETNIASEHNKSWVETWVNNDLGKLLASIQSEIMEAHNDDHPSRKLFLSAFPDVDNYAQWKNEKLDQYNDLLNLVGINNYLENTGRFMVLEGSAQEAFIKEYNDSVQVAAINNDKDIAANTAIANHPAARATDYIATPWENRRDRYSNTQEIGETWYEDHSRRTIA